MPTEQFTISDAAREDIPFRIGLLGPSGSGKTLSALRMSFGMKGATEEIEGEAGPVVLIDTENRRALLYAPAPGKEPSPPESYAFKHVDLRPPFHPGRIKAVMEKVMTIGPSVVVVDSFSHEWMGPGGILELVDNAQTKNPFGAWNTPKKAHRELLGVADQLQVPVIYCYRAKEKMAQVGNDVVNLGWQAIHEPGIAYDMTLNFLLGRKKKGSLLFMDEFDEGKVYIDMENAGILKDGELATEDVGRRLALWAAGRLDLLEAE